MTRTLLVTPAVSAARRAWLEDELGTSWGIVSAPDGLRVEDCAEALASTTAMVGMSWPSNAPRAPNLRLIQLIGAGFDGIDFDAVADECAVCNVFEHEIGIAEYIVAAMLEWEIKLAAQDRALREGRWIDGFAMNRPLHGELFGKTVGFLGYGHIAHESAKRLKAFGMRTMARTRTVSRCDEWIDDPGGMVQLDHMASSADYIVVTAPLTPATQGLVDAAFLARMKGDAVIINVARGALIDEMALYEVLRSRRIGGAIIDTWYRYPEHGGANEPFMPSNQPFHQLDNILMTPHSSGWSAGLLDRRWRVMSGNLHALESGAPLVNQLKPSGGPLQL
ncbi:MAG: phosphoglycerate dehydrogenase [Chromatiales bacterium]|jgi:phosphoglycerate dehydrogenase-like enzyme|nr:phosphoglycerate dehydrogenase [Chromatiales bacterium]